MHCFSMQVVMNKCFLLNPEKEMAQLRLVVWEKRKKTHLSFRKMTPETDFQPVNSLTGY